MGIDTNVVFHGHFGNLTQLQGSLLWLAMTGGQAEAVQALLDGGYDVNRRHTNLETPLHLAIRLGDVAMAMKLLVLGASPDIPGPCTPFCILLCCSFYFTLLFFYFATLSCNHCES